MKTIVSLILVIIPLILFSQKSYAPLGAEWKYEGHSLECTGFHQKFIVESESIINDKDCSIIHSYIWNNGLNDWIITGDSLIVWEDDEKVYFLEDTSFYLLYDFGPSINDTIQYYDPINKGLFSSTESQENQNIPNQISCVVKNIDEIEIESGQILKRFETEYLYTDSSDCTELGYVLENVGSLSQGITGDYCYYVTYGCFGGFVCYRNETIEVNSERYSCELFTSNSDLKIYNDIKVFPNPTSSDVFIEFDESSNLFRIEIYNLRGEMVTRSDFASSISLEKYSDGVYLMKLIGLNEEVFIRKIIKN